MALIETGGVSENFCDAITGYPNPNKLNIVDT
jgi:hypothetical protein